jgi:hypothetical protein
MERFCIEVMQRASCTKLVSKGCVGCRGGAVGKMSVTMRVETGLEDAG